jgi:two-component system response regulator YesN
LNKSIEQLPRKNRENRPPAKKLPKKLLSFSAYPYYNHAGMPVILLVDDEVLTRNGIRDNIAWDEIGIDTVLTARNGTEALKVLSSRRPDILLTDIRMPRMDGIDLANHIRGKFPDCAILFLSGYSDEDYLRSAIKVKAERYVNKPVDLETLSEILGEIMEDIREQQRVRRQMEQSSRVVLGLMMSRQAVHKTELYEALASARLEPGRPLSCLIFQAAVSDDASGEELDIRQLQEDITSLFTGHGYSPVIYADAENTVVCFLFSPSPDPCPAETPPGSPRQGPRDKLRDNPQGSRDHIRRLLHNHRPFPDCAIALGETVPSVEQSSRAFATARDRLRTSFYLGTSSVLSDQLLSPSMDASLVQGANAIKGDLSRGRYGQARGRILKLQAGLIEKLPPVEQAKSLLQELMQAIGDHGGGPEPPAPGGAIGSFENISTLDGCMGIIMDRLGSLEHGHGSGSRLADMARDIIENQFNNQNLSITMLCDELTLTAPYLCYLFKLRHGMTINHYINKIRIETAKNLLSSSQLKIHDIARRCGFNNTNYFTRSFKKNTGLLPTLYRAGKQA